MGSYSNGVYVPAAGEAGWDGEMNDFLTRAGNAYIDVTLAPYGADPTGVSSSEAAFTAAFAAADTIPGQIVFVPTGTYKFSDGAGVTVPSYIRLMGAGRTNANISVKNAYAFTMPNDDVYLSGIGVTVRAGATSGGAVKVVDASGIDLERIQAQSVSSCTTPGIWINGGVNCNVTRSVVSGCDAHGIQLDAGASFNNLNSVSGCVVTSIVNSTNAGIYVEGGKMHLVERNEIESCDGYGIYVNGTNGTVIGPYNWMEGNENHNLLIAGSLSCQVMHNSFNLGVGGVGDHINITRASPGSRDSHYVFGNLLADSSNTGVRVRIGANVEDTCLAFNRGVNLGDGFLVDSGTRTTFLGGDSATLNELWLIPRGVKVNHLYLQELTSGLDTPAANTGFLFMRDTGGKTELCVNFATGGTQVIAAQP